MNKRERKRQARMKAMQDVYANNGGPVRANPFDHPTQAAIYAACYSYWQKVYLEAEGLGKELEEIYSN